MSVFADERVHRLLKDHFVCVAQDADFTDRHDGDDALAHFYDRVVEQRDRAKFEGAAPTPTQGYYVFDHHGKLFDAQSFNHVEGTQTPAVIVRTRKFERLVRMLESAVETFRPTQGPVAELADARVVQYPPMPPGTTVLRSWSRIRPMPEGAHEMNTMVGRDFCWVRPDEVASLAKGQMPETLARRLVLGNFRDNIRGMPRTFAKDHIQTLALTARVEAPGRIRLGGTYRVEAPAREKDGMPVMGSEGTIDGLLVLDDEGAPRSWWIYADITCWGSYPNTPNTPEGRYPLKVGLVLAEKQDTLAHLLPPLAATGDVKGYVDHGIASRRGDLD